MHEARKPILHLVPIAICAALKCATNQDRRKQKLSIQDNRTVMAFKNGKLKKRKSNPFFFCARTLCACICEDSLVQFKSMVLSVEFRNCENGTQNKSNFPIYSTAVNVCDSNSPDLTVFSSRTLVSLVIHAHSHRHKNLAQINSEK